MGKESVSEDVAPYGVFRLGASPDGAPTYIENRDV